MSADSHRAEATQERRLAKDERAQYHPPPERPIAGDKGELGTVPANDPTEGHLFAAQSHENHARQHEAAARSLQKFEEGECGKLPASTRASCPLLGPVSRLEDIPGGVRVWLAPGARTDAVVAQMRCHFAYARARGFSENVSCPLYVRGIEIKKGRAPETIELTSPDAAVAREVRLRSREEATPEKRQGS
jgi:hypothetical protein